MSKLEPSSRNKTYTFCPYQLRSMGCKENLEKKSPLARSGHRIVVSDDCNVYSFGGYAYDANFRSRETRDVIWMQDGLLFKELWKFNLVAEKWTKLKTKGAMPIHLASHSDVLIGDKLYVFGGTSLPFGASSSNSTHVINLKDLTWEELNTHGSHPLQQYGQAIVLDNDNDLLYVVGGTTGFAYSIDVHCLDLNTKEWTELKAFPQPEERYRHEIIMEKDKIYVFGGGTTVTSFPFNQIPVFDTNKRKWDLQTTSGTAPAPRRYHGCVRVDDCVYISGGFDGITVFSDIWSLSLKTHEWKKLPFTLSLPVYFHSAAVSREGQMCIFGGVINSEENTRTNKLFSVWLKIPSLAEICWQAFLYYVPDIARRKRNELLAAGVPYKFVQRVDFDDKSIQMDEA